MHEQTFNEGLAEALQRRRLWRGDLNSVPGERLRMLADAERERPDILVAARHILDQILPQRQALRVGGGADAQRAGGEGDDRLPGSRQPELAAACGQSNRRRPAEGAVGPGGCEAVSRLGQRRRRCARCGGG